MPSPDRVRYSIPLHRRWWWQFLRFFCELIFFACYRFRREDTHKIPREGPVLIASNHQSFYDPIIIGMGLGRAHFALARSGLFNNPYFGWLIRSLNAISVAQGGNEDSGVGDLKAMRTCIDVLKDGNTLVLYPEGSRTPDGSIEPFETGTMLLLKRAKPTVVPAAIRGAFEVWPRGRRRPRSRGRVRVKFGDPIPAEALLRLPADDAMTELRRRVERLYHELR